MGDIQNIRMNSLIVEAERLMTNVCAALMELKNVEGEYLSIVQNLPNKITGNAISTEQKDLQDFKHSFYKHVEFLNRHIKTLTANASYLEKTKSQLLEIVGKIEESKVCN